MSSVATAWAMELPAISAHERLVLIYLADCHDPSTNEVHSSFDWLCDKTGFSADRLNDILTELRSIGLVSKNGFGLELMTPRVLS